jgi:hypothetical protein
MDEEGRRHLVYLIRLWRVGDDDKTAIWRASLQDVRTGQRRGFADLKGACHFLCAQINAASAGTERDTRCDRPSKEET